MAKRRRISTRELERRLVRRLVDDPNITSFDVELVATRLRTLALGYAFFEAGLSMESLAGRASARALSPLDVEGAVRGYPKNYMWRDR